MRKTNLKEILKRLGFEIEEEIKKIIFESERDGSYGSYRLENIEEIREIAKFLYMISNLTELYFIGEEEEKKYNSITTYNRTETLIKYVILKQMCKKYNINFPKEHLYATSESDLPTFLLKLYRHQPIYIAFNINFNYTLKFKLTNNNLVFIFIPQLPNIPINDKLALPSTLN